MKQIAFAALVIGVLFVVAQLVSRSEAEGDFASAVSISPSERETTFDGVRY